MIAEVGLGLSVVATALWSGLLLTLTTTLQPMYMPQPAPLPAHRAQLAHHYT